MPSGVGAVRLSHLVGYPMKQSRSISLVFPAWNEEEYVERSVARALTALRKLTDDFEIIIVNDASTDQTAKLCDQLAETYCEVRVIHHTVNTKLGGAIRSGFAAAIKDIVVYSDIDLPWDLGNLERAIHLLEYLDADLITAFRFDRTSEGTKRIAYSFAYNFLIRSLFGVQIKDINFSFKVLRRETLQAIDLQSVGSFVDAELVVKAIRGGFRVFQMGVDYFPRTRGVSTLASPQVIAKMMYELARLFPQTRWPVLRSVAPRTDNVYVLKHSQTAVPSHAL